MCRQIEQIRNIQGAHVEEKLSTWNTNKERGCLITDYAANAQSVTPLHFFPTTKVRRETLPFEPYTTFHCD